MTITAQLAYWAMAFIALAGAVTVVFTRDVTRLALGLGAFLLAVAGWFLYFAQTFLAIAQVFVYVGGVLVLVLFAIMMFHRPRAGAGGAGLAGDDDDDRPGLDSRHSIDTAMVAIATGVLLVASLRSVWPAMTENPVAAGQEALASLLLGPLLVHFEAAGLLLLTALVAALVILGGDRE